MKHLSLFFDMNLMELIQDKNSGIYKITNTLNNKIYIGSAKDFYVRCKKHKSDLKLKKHHSRYLQSAVEKYGIEHFKFEILEFVNIDILIEREQFYIDLLKPNYNVCLTAGSSIGVKRTDEFKRKCSLNNKGKKHTAERIENNRKSLIGKNLGSKSGMAKTFKFSSPTGEIHIIIGSFLLFCKSNGLGKNSMRDLFYEKRIEYRGWKKAF